MLQDLKLPTIKMLNVNKIDPSIALNKCLLLKNSSSGKISQLLSWIFLLNLTIGHISSFLNSCAEFGEYAGVRFLRHEDNSVTLLMSSPVFAGLALLSYSQKVTVSRMDGTLDEEEEKPKDGNRCYLFTE